MTRASTTRSALGGAAAEAGSAFRVGVASVLASHLLRGWDIEELELPSGAAVPLTVELETDETVDDIGCQLEGGGTAFVQAKRELRLVLSDPASPLRKAVEQCKAAVRAERIDPSRDRLVLACQRSSRPLRELAAALRRRRNPGSGSPSPAESNALSKLTTALADLSDDERKALLDSLTIWVVDAEEVTGAASVNAALMLDGPVVRLGQGRAAVGVLRESLVARAARREGVTAELLLDAFRRAELQPTEDAQGVVSARLWARQQAAARYRRRLQRQGETIDLLGVGASLPPIPLRDLDADVRATEPAPDPGDDRPSERDVALLLRRRGRLLLTGLPGSGKSTALAATAAVQAADPKAPLPVAIRLDRLASRLKNESMLDALLHDAASEALPDDKPLLREEITTALGQGRCTLILDALDEARAKVPDVLQGLRGLLHGVHPDVEVLLSTRDVARVQASALEFAEARLSAPRDLDHTVGVLLEAFAEFRDIPDAPAWVAARKRWVSHVLGRDGELRKTPLLPVLLAIAAAEQDSVDRLPTRRADVLQQVVRDVISRREARRDPSGELVLGALAGDLAAEALLDVFRQEALVLMTDESPRFDVVVESAASALSGKWNLAPSEARGTAREAIRFWDECGIFLIERGESIAPRVKLFAELGEAWNAAELDAEDQTNWVRRTLTDPSYAEALKLAAGISPSIADSFAEQAAAAGEADSCFLVCDALSQDAMLAEHPRRALIGALIELVTAGGPHRGRAALELASMTEMPVDLRAPARRAFTEGLPADHARNAQVLSMVSWPGDEIDQDMLIEVLGSNEPAPLEPRPPDRGVLSFWLTDPLWSGALKAAAQLLIPQGRHYAEMAAAQAGHLTSSGVRILTSALVAEGHTDLVDEIRNGATRSAGGIKWREEFDLFDQAQQQMLRTLAQIDEPAGLTPSQQRRMDELVDVYWTTGLPKAGAWDARNLILEYPQHLEVMAQAAIKLGGFDARLIAAQATRLLAELGETPSEPDPEDLLHIPGQTRTLDGWDQVTDAHALAERLVQLLRLQRFAADFAWRALADAPRELDVAALASSVLTGLRAGWRRELAALVVLVQSPDAAAVASKWMTQTDSFTRRAAAIWAAVTHTTDTAARSVLLQSLQDEDAEVRDSAISHMSGESLDNELIEALRAAPEGAVGWQCAYCNQDNNVDNVACQNCHRTGPERKKHLAKLLGSPDA